MILRYPLNDNQEMADKAEQYLNDGNVSVAISVIAEVVYVLKGVYSINTLQDYIFYPQDPQTSCFNAYKGIITRYIGNLI